TWQLSGPSGQIVDSTAFSQTSVDPSFEKIQLADIGPYRLTVAAMDGAVGAFSFNLLTYASAPELPLDAPQSVNLAPGNSKSIYKVDGNAGDYLSVDVSTIAGGEAGAVLIDTNGQRVQPLAAWATGGKMRLALPSTGS